MRAKHSGNGRLGFGATLNTMHESIMQRTIIRSGKFLVVIVPSRFDLGLGFGRLRIASLGEDCRHIDWNYRISIMYDFLDY